jgi:hypothetical protein
MYDCSFWLFVFSLCVAGFRFTFFPCTPPSLSLFCNQLFSSGSAVVLSDENLVNVKTFYPLQYVSDTVLAEVKANQPDKETKSESKSEVFFSMIVVSFANSHFVGFLSFFNRKRSPS